ncbi:MAG: glutaredoxin domain-containing protein [Anaerolineales bacterium]|jgi:mycoredoxin
MQKIILYGHSFCPQVYTVRRELDRNAVEYDYVDIRQDGQAAARVRQINNGFESVPTLVFADGSTLTEPSTVELLEKLSSYGQQVKPASQTRMLSILLEGPTLRLIAALLVLAGIFSDLQVLTWIGLFLLAISFVLFFLKNRS